MKGGGREKGREEKGNELKRDMKEAERKGEEGTLRLL